MIFIRTDRAIDTLKRLQASLDQKQIAVVESRSINKTLGKTRTQARREVTKIYNIAQRYLKTINFQPARPVPGSVFGKLYADRKPIPLDAFGAKQETGGFSVKISKGGKQSLTIFKRSKSNHVVGVSIEIFKGKRILIPFAFLIAGGAIRVFARGAYKTGTQYGFVQRHTRVKSTGTDTPIKPLITISEFGAILNDKVLGRIAQQVMKDFPEIMENQVVYLLSTIS